MEEVWEKVDNFEADQFKPKAFFKLHDINGDGFLDESELEAIMLKEV
jgi:Ca2+-binding EF-hand superfamily protein